MGDLETSRVNIFLHAENVRFFGDNPKPRLPVTIVSGRLNRYHRTLMSAYMSSWLSTWHPPSTPVGFLGAGKTTLLRHLLSNKSNLRIAAAINDFAELNIDEDLVTSSGNTERVVELSNGYDLHSIPSLQLTITAISLTVIISPSSHSISVSLPHHQVFYSNECDNMLRPYCLAH